ncbi:MAG: ADOP family duplicated permease [Gemmatimonadaceae bacterium]
MKRSFRLSDSKPNPGRDVSDELRFHLEMRTQEFIEQGMTPDDARRAARAAFGDVGEIEAEVRSERARRTRERRHRDWRRGVAMDFTYALRTLRRNGAFAATAVLMVTLGIGAAAAAFAVVNGVLLRPMPYADPSRLVMVWTVGRGMGGVEERQWPLSAPNYLDIAAWQKSLEGLAAFRFWPYTLGDATGDPEMLAGSRVSAELFPILGVRPLLGRAFTADEARAGGPKVAVIGHDLWQRRFGGSAAVLGRQVTLSGERFTIVGVMPRGFAFPRGAELPAPFGFRPRTELWTPLVFSELDLRLRGTQNLAAVGRIKRGLAVRDAQSDLAQVARRLGEEYPRFSAGTGLNVVPLKEQAAAPVRRGLLLLMGSVGFVLLIACANVANLLLARTAGRAREFAVRAALGASRVRVARQLVTENLVLTFAGAALSLPAAVWGSRALLALVPGNLPRADDVAVDVRVVLVTVAVATAAGVIFGIATAFHSGHATLASGLQGVRSTAGLARGVGRRALVAAEVALSLVLLVGAGLLTQSFLRLHGVPAGFDRDGAMTAGLLMRIGSSFNPAHDGPRWSAFFSEYADRLSALPGVEAAGGVSSLPLSGSIETAGFAVEGQVRAPGSQPPSAAYAVVTPGYFRAMRIPMVAGRTFDSRDRAGGLPVVVVNEEFARRYWPGEAALGKRIIIGFFGPSSAATEVVGVVGDVRQTTLDAPMTPAMYFPVTQLPYPFLTFVVRTKGSPPTSALPLMRRELKAMDPSLALHDAQTLREVTDASLARQRFSMIVIGTFAATALVLAMVGLYGVIAYSVAQRTREIGVRIALGASSRNVLALVVGEGVRLAAVGVVAGLAVASATTRLMRSLLYGVSATDAGIYAAVALLTAAVAVLASCVPARRATRVSPTAALREG